MDFNFSPEDEAFRKDLRAWLEANAPKGMENSDSFGDEADDSDEWARRDDFADHCLSSGTRACEGPDSIHRTRRDTGGADLDALGQ